MSAASFIRRIQRGESPRKIVEECQQLLVEKRLKDVSFEDIFGGRKGRTNPLEYWDGPEFEHMHQDILWKHPELSSTRFSNDTIRSSETYLDWTRQHDTESDPDEAFATFLDALDEDPYLEEALFAELLMDTKEGEELIKEYYLKERFREVRATFGHLLRQNDGEIPIWRELRVSEDWLSHLMAQGDHLGVYWSWHERAAEAHWGRLSYPHKAVIQSSIPEKQVNWEDTILANLQPSIGEMEKEVRLFKNTPIQLDALWIDGEKVELPEPLKQKTFRA